MARHLFIAQQTLATWMDQDKIDFEDNIMTIRADGRQFKLIEAVRFVKVEGGDEDTNGLLGKVKTGEQLDCLDAERYRDSVILNEVAYKVQEGFIGEVFLANSPAGHPPECKNPVIKAAAKEPDEARPAPAEQRPIALAQTQKEMAPVSTEPPKLPNSPSAPARPAQPRPRPEGKAGSDDDLSDEELLTRFLLDNL